MMKIVIEPPAQPGIYVAQPVREDLVPVTRDPRYTDTCARVNCFNVKVGKAKSLSGRKKNYIKDFDEDNIVFTPLLVTEDFHLAETIILQHLSAHRKRSPKGRPMDWLERISMEDTVDAVFEALDRAGHDYQKLSMTEEHSVSETPDVATSKKILLTSHDQAEEYIARIRESAAFVLGRLTAESHTDPMALLAKLKYDEFGRDPLAPGRPLNLIEQINQTFTYLASFQAAELLFDTHPSLQGLHLNLGTTSGYDIESVPGGMIAGEVFAATRPTSNNKLNKDVKKVLQSDADFRYVFFTCPGIEKGEYKPERFPGVKVMSLGTTR